MSAERYAIMEAEEDGARPGPGSYIAVYGRWEVRPLENLLHAPMVPAMYKAVGRQAGRL